MPKKITRISCQVSEEVNLMLERIAEKYCTTKSNWLLQAGLEKLDRIEKEARLLKLENSEIMKISSEK